jgi:pimeloyl-ACP methyl ester carboxylesterase
MSYLRNVAVFVGVCGVAAILILICLRTVAGTTTINDDRASRPLSLAKQGFFYVGGRLVTQEGRTKTVDQMFVEYEIPAKVTSRCPIVMIHGTYQNGSNFLGTPDDREGWAEYFLRRGYLVYTVDQPARGRSAYDAAADGALQTISAENLEQWFTAIERFNLWPQAHLHTQWPGTGMAGDPIFEQFFASQNPSMTDDVAMDAANRAAGVALLRRIGPAVLLTHSRSGNFGWEIADDAPRLVKGIVAVEPNGPPFYDVLHRMTPGARVRPSGLSFGHLTYDPPVNTINDLGPKQEEQAQDPNLQRCWFASTTHKLPHLIGIPVAILVGEASSHAAYDHCTSQYLTQAGVVNDLVRLSDKGIRGNGHMMMIEKNNLQIAALIDDWINHHVK